MKNFVFYNPTRIVFGENTIAKLADLVPPKARVLVLYGGGSVEKNGTLAEVEAALGEREVHYFKGIEPNPEYETLMKAVEKVHNEKIDFLLAVGGGSVIDGTKFIAAAAMFEGDPWQIAEKHGRNIKTALPLASVLTLPATGSEMNSGGVVSRRAISAKLSFTHPSLFPLFSILDPVKTYTLPARQIANGVVDTFVHITEQYLTYPAAGMVQDSFSEGLLRTLIEAGPKALEKSTDYDIRANLMWTATLGLNGLIGVGVPQDWATHMIGHELTARFGLDHAVTLAIVLPTLLEVEKENKKEKLLQYANQVWHITQGSDDEKINQAIAKTRAFFEQMGIKTKLSEHGVKAQEIDSVIKQLEEHGMVKLGERGAITPDVVRKILEKSL